MRGFEIAKGSIIGKNHRKDGKNNQDAFCVRETEDYIIAVVSDGCGSEEHSDVGAKVGSKMIVKSLCEKLDGLKPSGVSLDFPKIMASVRLDVLANLRVMANQMTLGSDNKSFQETVFGHFLFTLVGAVLVSDMAYFFALGDGVLFVNGEEKKIGPFPNNMPPYLAYDLLPLVSRLKDENPDFLEFRVFQEPIELLDSFLVGTDGVDDIRQASSYFIPGKEEPIKGVCQFWEDDKYFSNPDSVRRRLTMINKEVSKTDWNKRTVQRERGYLADDTTLAVGRRKGDSDETSSSQGEGAEPQPN